MFGSSGVDAVWRMDADDLLVCDGPHDPAATYAHCNEVTDRLRVVRSTSARILHIVAEALELDDILGLYVFGSSIYFPAPAHDLDVVAVVAGRHLTMSHVVTASTSGLVSPVDVSAVGLEDLRDPASTAVSRLGSILVLTAHRLSGNLRVTPSNPFGLRRLEVRVAAELLTRAWQVELIPGFGDAQARKRAAQRLVETRALLSKRPCLDVRALDHLRSSPDALATELAVMRALLRRSWREVVSL